MNAEGVAVKFDIILPHEKAEISAGGVEYGSARWGTEKEEYDHMPIPENNIIPHRKLERVFTMSAQTKESGHAMNKNILVLAVPVLETRFLVKLNIAQMHSSYVHFIDPEGNQSF